MVKVEAFAGSEIGSRSRAQKKESITSFAFYALFYFRLIRKRKKNVRFAKNTIFGKQNTFISGFQTNLIIGFG